MDFSIVICTYNRARQVSGLVQELLTQELPSPVNWQILVVDNNSSDSTADVLEPLLEESKGRLAYKFEPRQGKSHALNSGVENTTGDVLVFIDDDITPESGWLQAYISLFEDSGCVGAGGRILPTFECEVPDWFDPDAAFPFKFDFGDLKTNLPAPPFGANMAYRRTMFKRYGSFRTDLGPAGVAGSGLGEDSEFGMRLLQDGQQLIYCPEAVVRHPVTSDQLSGPYLIDWHRRYGRSLVARGQIAGSPTVTGGVPRFLYRKLVEDIAKWLFTFGQKRRFYNRLAVSSTLGTISELRDQARLKRHSKVSV